MPGGTMSTSRSITTIIITITIIIIIITAIIIKISSSRKELR